MALLVPNAGKAALLTMLVKDTSPEAFSLRLYKNDYTPVNGSVAGDFTVADFTGYANVTLARASFGTATSADPSVITYAQQSFTCSGASSNTIYGYYVVGATSGTILWAERFASARTVTVSGDIVKVTPTLSFNDV